MSEGTARALMAIYDAAMSDDNWRAALDSFASHIGAAGLILVAADQVGLPFRIEQASSRYEVGAVKHYFNAYGHHDEPTMTRRLASTPPQQLLRDRDVWGDMAAIEDRPDYKWLREHYGIRRRAGLRLSENKGWMDLLALQFDRDWPDLDAAKLGNLGVLLPHMAKVVEINRRFSILRERYKAVLAALDHVRIGTCVVAQSGHVLVSNREARRIYDLRDGIQVARAGFLTLATGDATALLTSKIKAVTLTAAGEGCESEAIVFAERKSGARAFLIEIAPLRDSAHELEPALAGAIIFIVDPENHRVVSTLRLARLFCLTDAESEVCRHMIEGLSARDISELRGVGEETVKSQFKTIYAKTGTRRRVELVRLAVAIDPPIARCDGDE